MKTSIRTLGVGAVAIVAIVASLVVVRHRTEVRRPDPEPDKEIVPVAVNLNLDDIRTAGF